MKLDDIHAGDKLAYWHQQGAGMGAVLCFCEVVRVGPVKVRVRDESGRESWKYPAFFNHRVSDETYRQIVKGA
jgi:hypothetical protein